MKRKIYVIAFTLLGLLNAQWASAQDVTIRSDNGNCLPAVKGEGKEDTFYKLGGFALWKHNQLNFSMTTADSDGNQLSSTGQFENPANNIFKQSGSTALVLGRGNGIDNYVALTLPRGYRFTGYTIVFRRNVNIENGGNGQASFGEVVPGTWDWFSDDTHKTGLTYSTSAARQTITRNSESDTDMGNTLYFKLTNVVTGDQNARAFIELTSVTLRFTAEADYVPVTAPGHFAGRTAVDIPFSTSCVDLGSLEERTYAGDTRMSYSYENVKDLMANLTMFEAGSVENGTNFDGTSGTVVKYADNGTITANGDYFQIGSAGTQEKIYYIETPTYVQLNDYDKTKNPIAYRIVGAKIRCNYGTARPASSEQITEQVITGTKTYPTFTISGSVETYSRYWSNRRWNYTSNGAQTYYLTSSAGMSTDESAAAVWFMDDDGNIRLANDASKYLKAQNVSGTNNRLAIVGANDSPAKFAINSNGQITLIANANMYLCLNVSNYNNTNYPETVNYFQMINNGTYKASRTLTGNEKTINVYETQTHTVNYPAFTPSSFTVNLYDKTGTTVEETISISSSNRTGEIEITGLNNDAIKIGVEGIGLIEADLTLQALDPYIDQMTVACTDNELDIDPNTEGHQPLKITRGFTSTDFTVGGDAFYFNLPAACLTHTVNITFEDLYSHYADASYTAEKDGFNGSANSYSRYNFVKSEHFNQFGETVNNIYTNTSEAANPQKVRVRVGTVGSAPFTFNNSATVGTSGGTLIEYPFTLQNYTGTFDEFTFEVEEDEKVDTRYVFTTDETAYNISPATATQHRSYAFYTMEVHVQSATYEPKVEIKPVYSSTYCGADKTGSFYGAVITAPYQESVQDPNNPSQYITVTKQGFASTAEIFDAINTVIENGGKDDFNHTYADFTDSKQLLYLDFSQLAGTYVMESESGHSSEEDYSATNAANCLIFLPVGTSGPNNNVAYKISAESNVFQAAKDIVLTDKEPFYSPYQITVDANQKIEYKRLITKDKYGKVQNASIVMPFAVTVDNGTHTNDDGSVISLHTMQSGGALTLQDGKTFAYFPPVDKVTRTTANTPYMVQLTNNSSEDGVSFVVSQKGGTIMPTYTTEAHDGYPIINNTDYTITSYTSEGVSAESGDAAGTYNFTAKGTYAGIQIAKAENVFYFARNMFVNSVTLDDNIATAKVQPFRGYFTSVKTNGASSAKLASFDIIFAEGLGDVSTGIQEVDASRLVDMNAPVYDMQGRMVARAYRDLAGKNVEPGLYVVNGVKIMVK